MKSKRASLVVGLLVWLVAVQSGLSFYNPSTGRWLSRDPLSEPGFELMANRPKNRPRTQEMVHFQKGFAELLAVNPALAMRIQNRLAQLEKSSNTKVDPSAGNLYIFVQNDPVSKIDVLGLDVYYWYCWMMCPCRAQVGVVSAWTLWPVSNTALERCCNATSRFFCDTVMPPGGGNYFATLVAAEAFFQGCVIMNRP